MTSTSRNLTGFKYPDDSVVARDDSGEVITVLQPKLFRAVHPHPSAVPTPDMNLRR
jgi:hypothetical protein